MNPVDKFYQRRKDYSGVVLETDRALPTHLSQVTKNAKGNIVVEIYLYDATFSHVKYEEREEVTCIIEAYIKDHKDEITKVIIKRMKKKMEDAREEVIKDFKLTESIKETD